jgi:hypothetical protein
MRHYLGRVFATFASLVLRLAVYDTQCGAKLFRVNPTVSNLFQQPFRSRWIFDVELLARFVQSVGPQRAEAAIFEYPLEQWRDVPGSKLRPKHFAKAAWDLFMIRSNYRLSVKDAPSDSPSGDAAGTNPSASVSERTV